MKLKARLLLLLCLLILTGGANVSANQESQRRPVPKDFSYPEASQTVEVDASAKSLSGVVRDPSGGGLPDALVERVDSDWKNRLDSTFTDSGGRFALPDVPNGKYCLKISKVDFSTLRIKVRVKKRAKSQLELVLPLGI
jgi:hypothetical protein